MTRDPRTGRFSWRCPCGSSKSSMSRCTALKAAVGLLILSSLSIWVGASPDPFKTWTVVALFLCVALIILGTSVLSIDPIVVLLINAILYGLAAGMEPTNIVEVIVDGFGDTAGEVAIVLFGGYVIGEFLKVSNSCESMAGGILSCVGRGNVTFAMAFLGFVVAIPVYITSTVALLAPLCNELAAAAGASQVEVGLAMAFAGFTTHSMVPPTPGPIGAAGILDADVASVIGYGLLCAIVGTTCSFAFVTTVAPHFDEAFKEMNASEVEKAINEDPTQELLTGERTRTLGPENKALGALGGGGNEGSNAYTPPAWLCYLPIGIPIVLIAAGSVVAQFGSVDETESGDYDFPGSSCNLDAIKIGGVTTRVTCTFVNTTDGNLPRSLQQFVLFVGAPEISLLLGAILALLLPERLKLEQLSSKGTVGKAIKDASFTILVTGAGGAFGRVITYAGTGQLIGETLAGANLGTFVPFLVAAGFKTSTGSATVANLASAGLMEGLLEPLGLDDDVSRALVCVSIGAGSMMVNTVNSPFYWVAQQLISNDGLDLDVSIRLQGMASVVAAVPAACMAAILRANFKVAMVVFAAFEILFPLCVWMLGRLRCCRRDNRPVRTGRGGSM